MYGHFISRQLLPVQLEQQSLLLIGRIDSLVEQNSGLRARPVLRWSLQVESCMRIPAAACGVVLPRVVLSAYDLELQPHSGERWQLRVKLKRPRGFANPGGFDYEAWLVAQRVGAVGYVEASADNRRLALAPYWSVAKWRGDLKNYLDARLRTAAHRDLLMGLSIGDGSAIAQRTWDTLRATGTVHLFVVSGLQIAFTGGLVLWFSRLWWRSPWGRNRRRDYGWGVLPALLAATLYALLAGFGLPIQRALIMFVVVVWALAARRELGADAWVLALWLVLLSDPLAVLDAGFWFSFSAVAVILLCLNGVRGAPGHRAWVRVQITLFITSLPLLLALTGQFTLLALPANGIAVPWTTLLTTPLVFVALLLDAIAPTWGSGCWWLADLSLDWLWRYLCWLQQWGMAGIWRPSLTAFGLYCAVLFALLCLLPRGTPGRSWALLFLLPLAWPRLEQIAPGDCRITVIDVGQGLSVLVQTATHNLLYDAGPLFGPERTVAELAIVPLLLQRGINRLDTVVISHKDSDHAGGWPTIAAQFTVARLLIGEKLAIGEKLVNGEELVIGGRPVIDEKLNVGAEQAANAKLAADQPRAAELPAGVFCRDDMYWRWDAVDFAILHPRANDFTAGNNRSCVLQIDAGGALIVLPGDIERAAEDLLLTRALTGPVSVLVAPHHGSRSSSTPAFVERMQPRYVVFSTGYLNRFRHPHPSVVERYRQRGAQLFNTADGGAISLVVRNGTVVQITQQRLLGSHYWQVLPDLEQQ